MVFNGKSGHIGSMLSTADIYPVLYRKILKVDPKNPKWPERDRFLLSKGHGGAALLACLAECGFFPMEWLDRYYCDDGKLSGLISHHIPGVEFSTGSLGHGLPVAGGMAMAAKRDGAKHRIVVMSSDGDLNEGSTWEAIMLAGQHHYDNLTMLVDYNRLQALGTLPLEAGKPSAIIFRTVKGKGVSFMENDYKWHYGGLVEELYLKAKAEVEAM